MRKSVFFFPFFSRHYRKYASDSDRHNQALVSFYSSAFTGARAGVSLSRKNETDSDSFHSIGINQIDSLARVQVNELQNADRVAKTHSSVVVLEVGLESTI